MGTPLQEVHAPWLDRGGVRLLIKREDLNHPSISGNKWHKLKHNLRAAKRGGYTRLLSFGGAYSNHIYALAAAGRAHGLETIGIIRGEAIEPLNPTLRFARDCGMRLEFISRARYRLKTEPAEIDRWRARYGEFYLIPEGGSNRLAVTGCAEIIDDIAVPFDVIVCPCGTGGTLAGLVAGMAGRRRALGIAVLKGASFLMDDVRRFLTDHSQDYGNWSLSLDYHFGGYAKLSPALAAFVDEFALRHGVPLEPVYTGKMMYGVQDLIRQGYFARGTTVVAVHTGGLQALTASR